MICLLVLIGMNAWGYGDSESSPEALLVSAAEEGNDQEIRHLLDLGVDVNSSDTVRPHASAEAIRAFTAQGIDIKSRFATLTALTRAISKNHSSTVRLLLESGADANLQSTNGTPLLIAITVNGSADMVKMLLEHGANPNSESDDNKSPLALLAALAKRTEAVQVEIARELIKFGAVVDYQNARGAYCSDGSHRSKQIAICKVLT
jgi:ankyrin repeat protein